MIKKQFIQVWLDLKNQNGCWNCKHDWSICEIHNIGSVGYIRGVSYCALKDWEYDKEKHKNSKSKYSWYKQYKELLKENEQLKCGNKNLKSTLNDFINILNRLQSNPNNKQTLNVARDMLQNMGVEIE